MENRIRKIVIEELRKNPTGYTVSELSKKLKISRHTIANVFAFLKGAKKIKIRQVGMAKIYFWSSKE